MAPPAGIPPGDDIVQSPPGFSQREAFARNIGLLDENEQERLATRCVAIPGLGGVGGIHAITLARLGIGRFHLADPDHFELANFNRQYGATMATIGQAKTAVIAYQIRQINPEAEIRTFDEGVHDGNMDAFLRGADLVVDGLDFFALDIRRMLFRAAAATDLYVVTAGPVGFSCAMLIFSPDGMGVDEYFGFTAGQTETQQRNRFAVGLTPRATHLPYMGLSKTNFKAGTGPSLALATDLCAGMVATEAVRILLRRGRIRAVPHYVQFDAYRRIYKKGYLAWGNRNPIQRAKIWYLDRRFR